ncbi:MAG: hypothetical protein IJ493_12270 [Clostridia bacterium]|nr:hypothetical protein [Clostridia bacterium]
MNTRRFVRDSIDSVGYLTTSAKLIWHPAEREIYYDKPRDSYICFHKRFSLDEKPAASTFRIFADSSHLLYVNSFPVTRGPARSDPSFQYYDTPDLVPYLAAGENIIAVLVLYYGTGHSMNRIPALFVDGEIDGIAIHTDDSWKCKKMAAFLLTPHERLSVFETADAKPASTPIFPATCGFLEKSSTSSPSPRTARA